MSKGAQVCLLCVFILACVYTAGVQVHRAVVPCREGSLSSGSCFVILPACTVLLNWLGGWVMLVQEGAAEVDGPVEEFGEPNYRGALAQPPPPQIFFFFKF